MHNRPMKTIPPILLAALVMLLSGCQKPDRTPLMVGLYFEMHLYATEHGGVFPASPEGPMAALQKLYPEYAHSGMELAGLTGDLDQVVSILKRGGKLGTNSSWIYVQGFTTNDDINLALFWEREEGILPNGRPLPEVGHTAMLLSGTITNVPKAEWNPFLE